MSKRPEHWVLCGGASHTAAPPDALQLATAGDNKNITVDVEGITKALTGELDSVYRDLILIASYVFAADQAISRGHADDTDMGSKWRRSFRFVVGVERPDLWSSPEMLELLQSTLSYLSDDYYLFEFQKGTEQSSEQLSLSMPQGEPMLSWDHIEEVVLFSGGLDSLGGVADQFLRQKKNIIAVSHRSAGKTYSVQHNLLKDLRALAPERTLPHVSIQVLRHDKRLRRDRNQRTRSFLYAAIAGTVAHLIGLNRILFYENGPVALNLPISRQLVGAKGTRTAHPKALRGFAEILSCVSEAEFEVENPFVFKTRAEAIKHIVESGAGKLIKHTVSCAYLHRSSKQYPHCGVCSQCVDRQFSVRAAGAEQYDSDEGYAVHLTNDEWSDEDARVMLLEYVDAAERFSRCANKEEFLSLFGEATRAILGLQEGISREADQFAESTYEVHRRHGVGIMGVISMMLGDNPGRFIRGDIGPNSVVALLSRTSLERSQSKICSPEPSFAQVSGRESEYIFRKQGDVWLIRYRGGEIYPVKDHKGMVHIHTLLQRPGEYISTDELTAVTEGHETATDPLQISLGADQEAVDSIKERVRRLQEELEEAKEFSHDDDVIRIEEEMEQLAVWLARESRVGGKVRREPKAVKQSRDRVWKAIQRAIANIKKYSSPLATHLTEELVRGRLACYMSGER